MRLHNTFFKYKFQSLTLDIHAKQTQHCGWIFKHVTYRTINISIKAEMLLLY
ncbi:hypothetical protein ACWEWU_08925 [Staphylococcus xylosus]